MTAQKNENKASSASQAGQVHKSIESKDAATAHKQDTAEKSQKTVVVFGHEIPRANLLRIIGLLGFFIVLFIVVALLWPMIGRLFTQGPEALANEIRSAGPLGVLILLGIQFLQIILVLIPGEVVQLAAGMMYGPWLGALIIVVGCVVSSFVIYQLVHRLGQPFVEDMVSTKYLDKFREFEKSGRLNTIVFILFLIPGMPKDVFTYLVPLTDMPIKTYLLITTIARFPGIIMSTYAASGFMDGNIKQSIIILVVLALIAALAFLFKDKLLALFKK
ncbi:MAG: TVP38/TMEM64 family protein [Eggerthellaceae bacterium]|nr:TVP38/TMEM64 family protein [Eggerthellaceae bacterium]